MGSGNPKTGSRMVPLRAEFKKRIKNWIALVATFILLTALLWPRSGIAASNTAIDPGGGNLALTASGPVSVTSAPLSLRKQARDLGGTVLPNGSNVAAGTQIYFVLYVDNTTAVSAQNIQLSDLLNETQFTYLPNSLETTIVASGASDAAIWAGLWSPLTDGLGGPDDLASITNSGGPVGLDRITIGAVPGQINQTLDITGGTLRAIRFVVTVN